MMDRFGSRTGWQAAVAMLVAWTAMAPGRVEAQLQAGSEITVQGMPGRITRLDALPFVQSTYSERMIWQRHDDPRLHALREELRLDDPIRPGRDEFERQILLMSYVARLWQFGDPRVGREEASPARIIEMQRRELRFYCEQYACVMGGVAASLGWVYRLLSHDGHTWGEIWSNQYGKWVYMDPTSARYATNMEGVPLNDGEAREDFFRTQGRNIQFRSAHNQRVIAPGSRFDRRKNMIGFHPNTNLLDERFDYEHMFMIRDEFSRRRNIRGRGEPVENPLVDPYFPINQAALTLQPSARGLAVNVRTLTPNFKTFRARADGGPWRNVGADFEWRLHGGLNVLEAKSINQFEVDGPVSRVEVEVRGTLTADNDHWGPLAREEEGKVAGMPPLRVYAAEPGELVPVSFAEELPNEWISMWHTPGHWVEWAVEVPVAGRYTATVFYSSSYYPRRAIHVNGRAVQGLESIVLAYTGGWNTWQRADLPVPLDLQAGRNTIRLTGMDETGVWIRHLRLTPVGSGAPVDVNAVGFVAQGGGSVQRTLVPTTGFLMYSTQGHWLEWDIEAPAAGDYEVFMVVGALVDAARAVRVNGDLVENPDEFRIDSTGGWRVFTEIPFGRARLRAGRNVVRTENLTADSPNLASLRFVNGAGQEVLVRAVDFVREGGGTARQP